MAYIGKQPTSGDFVLLDSITTSATASYTMQRNSVNFEPQSANHMIVSLNGTIQAPVSSFTALTDGSTSLAASITPSSTSSNVLMMVSIQTRIANAKGYGVQFKRAGTQIFASQGSYEIFNNNAQDIYGRNDWIFYDTGISTTSATEYTVFVKTDSGGNVKFQNNNDVSKIFLWEILA